MCIRDRRKLALLLQTLGYDVDNHFIRRVETGERYVTDIELEILSKTLHVSLEELIKAPDESPTTENRGFSR